VNAIICRVSLFVFLSVSGLLAQNQFWVAVSDQKECTMSDGGVWNVEIGDVFLFIDYVSSSEIKGGPETNDKEFVGLQVDDKIIIAPTKCFQVVPDKDIMLATAEYRKLVEKVRAKNAVAYDQILDQIRAAPAPQEAPPQTAPKQLENTLGYGPEIKQEALAERFGGLPDKPIITSEKSDRTRKQRAIWESGLVRSLPAARQLSDEELDDLYPQALQILETRKLRKSLQP
jgi:hypothetical protein